MESDQNALTWAPTHQLFAKPQDENDTISAVAFNSNGNYIAVGNKSGYISIFKKGKNNKYEFFGKFRSHTPEFDYLKSLEIEEKINRIKFLPSIMGAQYLLSTNDKTIKLWKTNSRPKKVTEYKKVNGLKIPCITKGNNEFINKERKVFSNAHAYHINSVAPNNDGETFISSDDLRINLWNIEITNQSFTIVDIKPENMEELTEVITAAEFHPTNCSLFMYSSSKGTIKLCDMRSSALCDHGATIFEEEEDPVNKSFFSEIISSISDIKFSNDGRYILARDYMTLKLWDIKMNAKPVKTVPVHDYLKAKLCDLYENDSIFDKFECCLSGSANQLATGSYGDLFVIYDIKNNQQIRLEVGDYNKVGDDISAESLDFENKCTQLAYHPTQNVIAISGSNNVVLYQGKPKN